MFSKDLIILADSASRSAPRIPDRRFLFSSPVHFLSLGLGSGLSPKAPGTAGSLAAVPLYLLLYWKLPAQLIFMLCIPLFALGVWLCQRRLHQGLFHWPLAGETVCMLSANAWQWLVAGVEWQRLQATQPAHWHN